MGGMGNGCKGGRGCDMDIDVDMEGVVVGKAEVEAAADGRNMGVV